MLAPTFETKSFHKESEIRTVDQANVALSAAFDDGVVYAYVQHLTVANLNKLS